MSQKNNLSLNQRSFLSQAIHRIFPELDTELIWQLTGEITDKQYNFLWAVKSSHPDKFKEAIPQMLRFYQLKN